MLYEVITDIITRYTDAYPDEMFVIGCNKHSLTCNRLESPDFDPKNVLVPYEYFANTIACGRYVKRLVDLGFTVFFKARPDEPWNDLYHGAPGDQLSGTPLV